MFERFTNGSRRVLVLAQEEARLLDHSFIGTEHLLLGLLHEGGLAAQALASLGISLEGTRAKVQETVGMAGTPPSGSPPFTPRAKKVLELSLREALQRNQSYIGTEHLLLGLVREGEGVAANVLVSLGADLGSVRQAVITLMSAGHGPDDTGPVAGREWAPPIWDRPSAGTVPVVLAVNALVLQSDFVAVSIDRVEVYPNGFVINLLMRVDPRKVRELMEMLRPLSPNPSPRVRVRFADGRTAEAGPGVGSMTDIAKDTNGVPTEPFMTVRSPGGAADGWRAWAWVFPLPPDGPVEVFVGLEAAGLAETSVTIDGTAINAVAQEAKVIWI
jgi:Clp amino terminal domain, pathogenicity island component